jgi:hypothetical protein
MLGLAAAATARAFVPIPPDESILTSSRWSAIGHASALAEPTSSGAPSAPSTSSAASGYWLGIGRP